MLYKAVLKNDDKHEMSACLTGNKERFVDKIKELQKEKYILEHKGLYIQILFKEFYIEC